MRVAVLADVHANLPALEAVIADARRHDVTDIWHLGDAVGYGAEPFACLQLLSDLGALLIAGNHELATLDPEMALTFNPVAAKAIFWTRGRLSTENLPGLSALPITVQPRASIILFHGALGNANAYIRTAETAEEVLASMASRDPRLRIAFFGHTHRPMVFTRLDSQPLSMFEPSNDLIMAPGRRYIVNPGSVGQPRNGDPRAHYLIYDSDTGVIFFRRVPYDVQAAQSRILEAGLPPALAARLAQGL